MIRYRYAIIVFFFSFYILAVQAQETPQPVKKEVQLSPQQMKALEGVYQFSQNKEMNVQFTAQGSILMGKLLWNNNQIKLLAESDSVFNSAEPVEEGRTLTIRFRKDQGGMFNRVLVGGSNDVWNKVNDYKPVVKTEISHTPEQLKMFEGLYNDQGNKSLFIEIKEKDNKLNFKQYWNNNEMTLVPDSALHFFSREQTLFTASFFKDGNGDITRMLAFGRDKWDKLKPAQFTPQQMKVFEGKYQLKDDKDDLIRVTATATGLVVTQLWDKKEIILEPKTETFFYCGPQSYSLNFIKDKDGAVTQALVLNTDLFEKVKE